MVRMHLYLTDALAEEVRNRAKSRGMTVSAYLTEILRSHLTDPWPEGFFSKVVGGWAGAPLERPEQFPLERGDDD